MWCMCNAWLIYFIDNQINNYPTKFNIIYLWASCIMAIFVQFLNRPISGKIQSFSNKLHIHVINDLIGWTKTERLYFRTVIVMLSLFLPTVICASQLLINTIIMNLVNLVNLTLSSLWKHTHCLSNIVLV